MRLQGVSGQMADCIVVGCGFSGAVIARRLAEEKGDRVLILERRPAIGGNMYDGPDEAGVLVQRYGPHIFHTGNERAFHFIEPYSEWIPYEHRVRGRIGGKLVPIPFNFTSLEALFPAEQAGAIEGKLRGAFPGKTRVSVLELLEQEEESIRSFGEYVYENVFRNYTAKQWGTPIDRVDRSTINRVPVVLGTDDRYFSDTIQQMPTGGFTRLFERMLDHPNITVRLNCDALTRLRLDEKTGDIFFDGRRFEGTLVYTGCIDELLGFRFGPLPYRSIDMQFETIAREHFQPVAVVNYPNEERFTRITEFKYLTRQELPDVTTIMREYPLPYDKDAVKGNLPFYPIVNEENMQRYRQYRELLGKFDRLVLCGRLAEYRYYNMDAVILRALELTDRLIAPRAAVSMPE